MAIGPGVQVQRTTREAPSTAALNERMKPDPPLTMPFPYGSTLGGIVVALVALAVSIPVSIATVILSAGR